MTKPKVELGVACLGMQNAAWWSNIMQMIIYANKENKVDITGVQLSVGMLNDRNKNAIIGNSIQRLNMTDEGRNKVTKGFLATDADYIFWIDDDTVPPHDAIYKLLKSGHEFISGIYFLGAEPYNPIAYVRNPQGFYNAIDDWQEGAIMEVDSVGMGCALIHRSVYEKILDQYDLYRRNNGSLQPIHKKYVQKPIKTMHTVKEHAYIKNGVYREQLTIVDKDTEDVFPYFMLEHNRTEDHMFCEMAQEAGNKIYVDTSILCDHWKNIAINKNNYYNKYFKDEGLE